MICEICIESVAGVHAAREAGAARVELCADLMEGGLTPSVGMIRQARKAAAGDVKVNVIIRPRGGDFLYDDDEFAIQRTDIEVAKAEGVDGVVIGLLNPDGTVDVERTRALIELARPMSVTFHRAFDVTPNPFAALDALIQLGVDRVLTSGQEPTVLDGLPLIVELMKQAGDRTIIMPGAGITARNVARIVEAARPREIHFTAFQAAASGMTFRSGNVFMGGELRPPEYDRQVTTAAAVRAVMAAGGG